MNRDVRGDRHTRNADEQIDCVLGDREVRVWQYSLDVDVERESALTHILDDEEHDRAGRFKICEALAALHCETRNATCDPRAVRSGVILCSHNNHKVMISLGNF